MQDEAARLLLLYPGGEDVTIELTPEEDADLFEAEAARGELASDAEAEAVLSKYRW